MATKTLTVPVAPGSSCNGALNSRQLVQLTVLYPQGGIIGWKKRTLYILLILLVSVVVINMTLILWIIKILDLTSEGPGKIRLLDKGLQLYSTVEFLDSLSGKYIIVNPSLPLKIESDRNVSMQARNSRGFITNILSLGEAGLQAIGNYFIIRDPSDNILLQVDSHDMVVSANHMVVSESGGFRLDGSLETPLVRGSATKDLRSDEIRKNIKTNGSKLRAAVLTKVLKPYLSKCDHPLYFGGQESKSVGKKSLESLLKKVKIRSEGKVQVNSPAGGISVSGLKDMNLKSTGGRVVIDSSRLEMKNLKLSRRTPNDRSLQEVYQVCMCDNGRLFLAHREGYCQIQESVCKDTAQDKYRLRDTRSRGS